DADADADANVNVGDTTPVEAVGPALDTVTLDTVTLIDPGQAPAVADTSGWNYRRSASVDIDGDGEVERVVIAVRVEMVRGRPAWDDGHQWQVYVEEPDSTRTVVYARRLQLGTLTLRIEAGSGSGPRHIILVEHLPDLLAAYEVTYRGPSEFDTHARYQRTLDPTGELASPTLP
ncbi:MAG: hypothetical protein H0W15_02915, partial [Gemmatimonadales bacterium]|nr:hypothetical protein [Gemmatimonadales bacterium]